MTSTARSSGYNDRSGAKEHTLESVWRGALAYSNIGLPGAGFSGPHWDKKHKPVLLELFTKLLSSEEPVLGLLLCEVGNMDDLLDAEGKKRLERVITEAFRAAGATEHGEPQFIWSRDETMAAFRAEVQVRALDPLKKMKRVDAWRVVQRFEVTGATEHGPCSLLIYNNHQPKSQKRKFPVAMAINLGKAVLRDAKAHVGADPSCCGFGFGGDANCTLARWNTAFSETPAHLLRCKQFFFMYGVGGKGGDLMVGAGTDGLDFYENTCTVEGRELQHDPMIMEWCYRAQRPSQPTLESIEEEAAQTDVEDSEVDFEGASEQSEESDAEDHVREIGATGFALMKSAGFLSASLSKASLCIGSKTLRTMRGKCTRDDMLAFQKCAELFFSRQAVLQNTPPRQDAKAARVLKPSNEIAHAWQVIMDRRRLEEPNDSRAITEPDTLKRMHNTWMHEWLDGDNLTSEQRRLKHSKKSSISAAWLNRECGGKKFIMALCQTGIQWAPTPEKIRDDYNGALEHVATNFAKWTLRVARAIKRHGDEPETEEARRNSGQSHGKHGLTNEEERTRDEKVNARRNYFWAVELEQQLQASKGKGKSGATEHTGGTGSKGAMKGKREDKQVIPKPWEGLSFDERWWLQELWSDKLSDRMLDAESKCHRVQAKDFVVSDDD